MDRKLGCHSGGLFSRHSLYEDSTVRIVYPLDFAFEPCKISSHDAHAVSGSHREPSNLVTVCEIVREPGGEPSSSLVLWGIEEHLPLFRGLGGNHSRSLCSLD